MTINNQHNLFKEDLEIFYSNDPQLQSLSRLKYQYKVHWWSSLPLDTPGIYILTGGRQIGKSTSCKLLIKHCLKKNIFNPAQIFYLSCDEIYDAKELRQIIRQHLNNIVGQPFLLIIDEITFVLHWERVIKSLADEGYFASGICLLTGSDSVILKEAAMYFPGRRGMATQTDFHLYPLTFSEYVHLLEPHEPNNKKIADLFEDYLKCGGYLRAINDLATYNEVSQATFLTYEQWIRGDFLRHGKNETYLLVLLRALLTIGVSPISYSSLTQKIGLISKDTCIDYMSLLERMDVMFQLQAFDVNNLQGFPRKDRKFHFFDPFIYQTIYRWLLREKYISAFDYESIVVEACVASHCYRVDKTFYYKGQGEIDIVRFIANGYQPIEVKWSNQLRPNDLKMLRQFKNSIILGKNQQGMVDDIKVLPTYEFLLFFDNN